MYAAQRLFVTEAHVSPKAAFAQHHSNIEIIEIFKMGNGMFEGAMRFKAILAAKKLSCY